MKTKFYFMIFMSFIAGCCNETEHTPITITVFVDDTEPMFCDKTRYLNDIPLVLQKAGVDTNRVDYSEVIIRYCLMSDIYSDRKVTTKLNHAYCGIMGINDYDRIDDIRIFQQSVRDNVNKLFDSMECGKGKSKIYETICRQLQQMKDDTTAKKYLIIYSDMLQNSEMFSFYGKGAEKRVLVMMEHVAETEQKLSEYNGCSLQKLNDVEIIIINQHKKENDNKAALAERFWRKLFEFKGAKKVLFTSQFE